MSALGTHLVVPVTIPPGPSLPTVGSDTTTAAEDSVDIQSCAYKRMAEKWPLLHDLLGGTQAMRDAAQDWLPQEPKEEVDAYNLRLNRSILYNALETTFDNLVSKPFSRSVVVEQDRLPASMQPMVENVTKSGIDLTTFAKDVFRKGLEYGLTHVLVDFPKMDPQATLADELREEARPTFMRIDPPDMLGWKTKRTSSGAIKLTQIRFREIKTEDEGLYGDKEYECIKVYNAPPADGQLGTWASYVRNDDNEWVIKEFGTHTFPGVPLVTFYTNRTGFMEGLPPFEDLMWLNVAHWQTASDVRNTLRMVLAAIFYATGIAKEDLKTMVFGPNVFLKAESESASFGFVEHSGAGIAAGRTELQEIEARMEQLGLKPLIERSSLSTATGKIIDENRSSTDIQAWIRILEACLLDAFGLAATWIQQELPDDFSVDVFDDFGMGDRAAGDLAELRAMRSMIPPTIDLETYLKEVKRRGLLSDEVQVQDIIDALDEETLTQLEQGDGTDLAFDEGTDPNSVEEDTGTEDVPEE